MPRAFRTRGGETFYLHAARSGEEGAPDGPTYYFSRDIYPDEVLDRAPEGLRVFEHPRSGVPLLAREVVDPDGKVTWTRVPAVVDPDISRSGTAPSVRRARRQRSSTGVRHAAAVDWNTTGGAEPDASGWPDRLFWPWIFIAIASGIPLDLAAHAAGGVASPAALRLPLVGIPLASLAILWVGQWLLLRPYVPRASRWILASVAGMIVSSPVTFGVVLFGIALLSQSGLDALVQTTVGLVSGLAQWAFLRTRVRNARWWIPVTAVAFVLRGFAPISQIAPGFLLALPPFAAMGATYGVITGAALAWLLSPTHVRTTADSGASIAGTAAGTAEQ
jgi:hypothetical protein